MTDEEYLDVVNLTRLRYANAFLSYLVFSETDPRQAIVQHAASLIIPLEKELAAAVKARNG